MTMVFAAPPPRRRMRDPEEDVETQIYVRQAPHAWDRLMVLQIMQDLGARPRAPSGRRIKPSVPAPGEPNVFLTRLESDPPPPWDLEAPVATAPAYAGRQARAAKAAAPTLLRRAPRRQFKMPSLLFVMAFGIAFGVGQDRPLRAELAAKTRATAAAALAVVESSAMRLGRHVSGTH